MAILRENSIKIQFTRSTKAPSSHELYRFMLDTLKLSMSEVCGVQMDNRNCCVFLKISVVNVFEELLKLSVDPVKFRYEDGLVIDVNLTDASTILRTVKVTGLPFEIENQQVEEQFKPYGKICRVSRDKWVDPYLGDIENGTRSVLVELKSPVPSRIIIDGYPAYVSYPGQEKTCHYCQEPGHFVSHCPKKHKSLPKEAVKEPSTNRVVPSPMVNHEAPLVTNLTSLKSVAQQRAWHNAPPKSAVLAEVQKVPETPERDALTQSDASNYGEEVIPDTQSIPMEQDLINTKRRPRSTVSRSPSPKEKKKNSKW